MLNIFRFKATVWNEYDNKEEHHYGVVCGEDMVDAAKRVNDYYGIEMYEITFRLDEENYGLKLLGSDEDAKNVWEKMGDM